MPTHRQRCAHHGMWTHLIKCVHPVANVQKALNPGMAQNKCNCRVTAKIPKVIRSVFGKVTTIEQHQCFPARYELGMCRARLVWNGYSVYMYLRRPCSSCGISSNDDDNQEGLVHFSAKHLGCCCSPPESPETLRLAVAASETAPEWLPQCQIPGQAPSCGASPAAWWCPATSSDAQSASPLSKGRTGLETAEQCWKKQGVW